MRILYRIVSAILAVCVPLSAFFMPLIVVSVIVPALKLRALDQEQYSIKRVLFMDTSEGFFGDIIKDIKLSEEGKALLPSAIAAAAFLVVAVLLSLVILFISALTNRRNLVLYLSSGGLLSMIGCYISFVIFKKPLIAPDANLLSLIEMKDSIISLIGGFVSPELEIFMLSSGYTAMLLLFIALVIWSVCFLIIDIGEDDKRKVIKKKM